MASALTTGPIWGFCDVAVYVEFFEWTVPVKNVLFDKLFVVAA